MQPSLPENGNTDSSCASLLSYERNSGSIAPKNVSYACKVLLDCESKLFASFSLHLPFLTHTERYVTLWVLKHFRVTLANSFSLECPFNYYTLITCNVRQI